MNQRIILVGLLAAALTSCGPVDQSNPMGVSQSALNVSYDCNTWQDTGYTNGNAFTLTLVTVDGYPMQIDTANAFLTMEAAANAAGITLSLNDGFRTPAQQQYYWNCYQNCNCNSCSEAAAPGYSNHQSGHAVDINMPQSVLNWMNANGPSFGFNRTVASETWHWEWWGGGSPQNYCGDTAPRGALDTVDCTNLRGWAQDPDVPGQAINVDFYYGGPAGSGAPGQRFVAGDSRADLCTALGSCNHAYTLDPPRSLMDGAAHPIHAYGIDANGSSNPELQGSPKSLTCAPTETGVRRHIPAMSVMTAWGFSDVQDLRPVSDATFNGYAAGPDWPATRQLIQGSGDPAVYVVDGVFKRHVQSPTSAAAWHMDLGHIQQLPPAQVDAMPTGPALRARPMLIKGSGAAIDVLDDPLPSLSTSTSTSSTGTTGETAATSSTGGTSGSSTTSGSTTTSGTTGSSSGATSSSTGGTSASPSAPRDVATAEGAGCSCGVGGAGAPVWALLSGLIFALRGKRRRRG